MATQINQLRAEYERLAALVKTLKPGSDEHKRAMQDKLNASIALNAARRAPVLELPPVVEPPPVVPEISSPVEAVEPVQVFTRRRGRPRRDTTAL